MKRSILWLVFAVLFTQTSTAQTTNGRNYRNFPLILTVQFHSLSYPVKDVRTNFRNIGFGIGSEISLGSGHSWAQQFQLSTYRNKEAGNGILLYTQSAWRPTIVAHVFTELKAGFGLTYDFRTSDPYRQLNGKTYFVGDKGKWLFTVPVGFSIGYNKFSQKTYIVPFASYQLLLSTNYAKGIPVFTNSLFQLGTRIHFSRS